MPRSARLSTGTPRTVTLEPVYRPLTKAKSALTLVVSGLRPKMYHVPATSAATTSSAAKIFPP